jgi:hypothetical protein
MDRGGKRRDRGGSFGKENVRRRRKC